MKKSSHGYLVEKGTILATCGYSDTTTQQMKGWL